MKVQEQSIELRVKEEGDNESADTDKWGYVVCFGTVITFIAGIGHVNSFGLIYNDFMIETDSTAKSLTTAHGVFAIMLAVGGIILNIITQKLTLRIGGLIGSAIFVAGSFATIFITNTNQLPFTFGILQGVGFGMMVPVSYATINYYFLKKRTTVMSMCKSVQGIIQMIYPQILKVLMNFYGFRGTLLIVSGIALNTIAGMASMCVRKPKKKKTDVTTAEQGVLSHENVQLMNGNADDKNLNPDVDQQVTPQKNLWTKLLEILHVKVLKDFIYCNICLGQSFVNFSDLTMFMLIPMLLLQYDYDKSQVAMCISIGAGADVAGRFALAMFSSIITCNTRLLFYMATLFTFVARLVLLQVREFIWVAIVTAVLGVLRAWLHVASPLVIASHVTHEDFPGAYALFMLSTGLVNVICGPLIGLLKDVYKDYVPAFYALTFCCLPCLLLWPIEYKIKKK